MNDQLDMSEIYSVIGPRRTMDHIPAVFHFERVMSAWRAQNELARLSGRTRSTAWQSLRRAVRRGQLAKCWPYEFDPAHVIRVQIGQKTVSVDTRKTNDRVPEIYRRAAMLHAAYRIMHPRTTVTFSIVEDGADYYYGFIGFISPSGDVVFYPLRGTIQVQVFSADGKSKGQLPWQHPLSIYQDVLQFVKATYSIM